MQAFSNSARHHHILSFIVGLEELLLCGLTDRSVPGNNVLGLYGTDLFFTMNRMMIWEYVMICLEQVVFSLKFQT